MKLLIGGAGGHGRVVADAALATGRFSLVAFLDDRLSGATTAEGWPIVGQLASLAGLCREYQAFAAGFGDASLRLEMIGRARTLGLDCTPIIHPAAVVSRYCSIGAGSVVVAGACVNVGACIGEACIVNTGATVDHDCTLADGVHVCPGAHLAGNVAIGARTWFGAGAVAREGLRIGANVTVGAGAVVVREIPDGVTVAGNPARELARRAREADAHDVPGTGS